MDGNVSRIQPVTPPVHGVQKAGQRDARKDAPPFDLEKEMNERKKEDSQPGSSAAVETPPVAPAEKDESGGKLDVVA